MAPRGSALASVLRPCSVLTVMPGSRWPNHTRNSHQTWAEYQWLDRDKSLAVLNLLLQIDTVNHVPAMFSSIPIVFILSLVTFAYYFLGYRGCGLVPFWLLLLPVCDIFVCVLTGENGHQTCQNHRLYKYFTPYLFSCSRMPTTNMTNSLTDAVGSCRQSSLH